MKVLIFREKNCKFVKLVALAYSTGCRDQIEMFLILSLTVLLHLVEKCKERKYLRLKKFATKN